MHYWVNNLKTALIYFNVILFAVGCKSDRKDYDISEVLENNLNTTEVNNNTLVKSVFIDTVPPTRLYLKDLIPPNKINVPKLNGGDYLLEDSWGAKSVQLRKPSVYVFPKDTAAGIYPFETINSDDGLALDAIGYSHKSCISDKDGNLWFATDGGGVSKYNGQSFTTYTTKHGLISNSVMCIAQDIDGNMWFGTKDGVSRFDGIKFRSFSEDDGLVRYGVRSLAVDSNGYIWCGTDGGGVCRFDGNKFTVFSTEQGLAERYVFSIAVDSEGDIWFGSRSKGISKYDSRRAKFPCNNSTCDHNLDNKEQLLEHNIELAKSFIVFNTKQGLGGNIVRSIEEDSYGIMWFGADRGGVTKYDGNIVKTPCNTNTCTHSKKDSLLHNKELSKSFTRYSLGPEQKKGWGLSIGEDVNGDMWFGAYGKGVYRYERASAIELCHTNKCDHELSDLSSFENHKEVLNSSLTLFTQVNGLVNDVVVGIVQDRAGSMWFGTRDGLSRFDGIGFKTITEKGTGFLSNQITDISHDNKGNTWTSSYGGGISKIRNDTLTAFNKSQGLYHLTKNLTVDKKGNVWISTTNGVYKYDGNSFSNFRKEQGLIRSNTGPVYIDGKDNLWVGAAGLSMFDGSSIIHYSVLQGISSNSIRDIFEDSDDNMWVATTNGVNLFDGKVWVVFTTEDGLASNEITKITEDFNGNLWFATAGMGLSVLRRDRKDSVINRSKYSITKPIISYSTKQGLANDFIKDICFDDKNRMILGTNYGIAVISEKEVIEMARSLAPKKIEEIDLFNQFRGYSLRNIAALDVDSDGLLWVANGNKGLTVVDLDLIYKSANKPTLEINSVRLKREEKFSWYTLDRSINSLRKDTIGFDTDSLMLTSQELLSSGKILSLGERQALRNKYEGVQFDSIAPFTGIPQNLILSYDQNAIFIEFNAIETSRNFLVQYQFMLEGMDNDWGELTESSKVSYNNLHEGNYIFRLKAKSPDGIWSEPIMYEFKVLPPWYRTGVAYIFYLVGFIICVWVLVKLQTLRLEKREKELEIEIEKATNEIREQKEHIEEVHKEITDSINYAERIQLSFLATEELLDNNLGEYFVFFKPKDVVSGDFYWADVLSDGSFAIVNADSTGHGVPGAIMSILNISSIEAAVKEGSIYPYEIFNKARGFIIERLKKDGSEDGGKDGMDASIICFNADKSKMTYTAAQNPIWIIRDEKVIQIKAEKMPVGKHDNDHVPFEGGFFDLQKGDQIYTLTDGFQDQFGGPRGKKFMIKNMREYVLSISHLSMKEQCQKLDDVFLNWKNGLEQVDDVCVIGMKI